MCRDTGPYRNAVETDGIRSFDGETWRTILEILDARSGVARLSQLADALSNDWSESRERLRLRLHHELLPRLEDAGDVVYESTSRYVIRLE